MEQPAIALNENMQRFETEDKEAFLDFRLIRPAPAPASATASATASEGLASEVEEEKRVKVVMDMLHTYVPRNKRGMGLANHLCVAAFSYAQTHSMLVIPTCSYISDTFLPRNPFWRALVYDEELKSSM